MTVGVPGNLPGGKDSVSESDPIGHQILFEQGQYANRGANFEGGRKGTHVGITDQEMEPPIFAIIRERFVTCVDNRPIKLHPSKISLTI